MSVSSAWYCYSCDCIRAPIPIHPSTSTGLSGRLPRRWGRRALGGCFRSVRETREHPGCVVCPGLQRVLWSSSRPSWKNQTTLWPRPYFGLCGLCGLCGRVDCHELILKVFPATSPPAPSSFHSTMSLSSSVGSIVRFWQEQTTQASPLL